MNRKTALLLLVAFVVTLVPILAQNRSVEAAFQKFHANAEVDESTPALPDTFIVATPLGRKGDQFAPGGAVASLVLEVNGVYSNAVLTFGLPASGPD